MVRMGKKMAGMLCVAAVMMAAAQAANAAVIYTNPITGTNPNTANPYTTGDTKDTNITVSGIGRGTGISGNAANDRYNANNWNSASLDTTDYFSWTLTPGSGFEIDFTSFGYTSQASGSGPQTNFAFRSSVDSYASNIGTPTVTGTTISLSAAAYQNITAPITFRFYAWGASSSTGTFSINSFSFDGTVAAAGGLPTFIFTDTSAVTINTLVGSSSSTATKAIQNNGTATGDATLSSVANLSVSGTTTGIIAAGTSPLTLAAATTANYLTTSGTLTVTPDGGANDVSVTVNVGNAVADTDGGFTVANALTAGTGSTIASLASKVVSGSSVAIQSEATLLEANDPTSNSVVSMNWRDRTATEQTYGDPIFGGVNVVLASDVVDLTGVISGALTLYTLQMNYDPMGMSVAEEDFAAADGFIYLAYLDGGFWVNAGDLGTFASPDLDGYNVGTDFVLGKWGVNTSSNTVWAVVDHSGEFAAVVPEPASLGLLALGGLALLGRRRK